MKSFGSNSVGLGLNPVVRCQPDFTETLFPKQSFPSNRIPNQPNYLHLAFGSRIGKERKESLSHIFSKSC